MEEEKIAELALKCFDGDPDKAVALLELLKVSLQKDSSLPDMDMHLPEEICCWEKEGNCWKDIPDSIRPCKKPCSFFESSI